MSVARNPFSAGRWVSGPSFFGRGQILELLLSSNESCDWIIGKRRVGKTSLLRQLENLINGNRPGFALFWDVQGSFDAQGLAESLIDAIEDSLDEYPKKWEGLEWEPDPAQNCAQILKSMCRVVLKKTGSMTLLIDEAEEFITIGKQDPIVLGKLRKVFQKNQQLHTVISSTPRLEQFHRTVISDTSPFLHGFHARYLGHFEEQACLELLAKGIPQADDQRSIIARTDGNPFELQLFAKHLFEQEDLEEVVLLLEANPSLSQVIEVNFELLNEEEQDILKDICCGKTAKDEFSSQGEKATLSKLLQLGYLAVDGVGGLRISSYFSAQWLSQRFDHNPAFHAQHATDVFLDEGHKNLIARQILTFYKFFLELAQDEKKLVHNGPCFKVSAIDGTIYPDKARIELLPETRQEEAWIIALAETKTMLWSFLKDEDTWSIYRFFEMVEKGAETYTENEFIDVMMLIAEEANLL